jgi:hypothetical protein
MFTSELHHSALKSLVALHILQEQEKANCHYDELQSSHLRPETQ